ncbi:uncharacterized protein LOC134687886 [Mytilus trossulus]|uniref:uncharacterized protein LOC134687886 n=1 Tax=Mytilus trossulus TaxID=6551 RepID=UPI003007BE90
MDVCSHADQVCLTVKDLNDNYQISYRLGCVKKEVCEGPLMSVFKHSCCSSDYCNAYNLDETTTSKQIATSTVQSIITNGGTATHSTTKAEHIGTEVTTIGIEAITIRTDANTNPNHITNQTSHALNCSGHSFYQWHGHCYYITTHSTPWGVNRNGHHKDPCIGHNMHMVVIDSDEEHNAIAKKCTRTLTFRLLKAMY